MSSAYNPASSAGSPHVRGVQHTGIRVPSLTAPRRATAKTSASLTRWIVRSVMIATTAFALLDLILLINGGRH